MTEYPQTIWKVPAYLPYIQPPLTEAIVQSKETELGVKLPPEYVALLKVQNGGYIRWRLPGEAHDVIRGIGPNFPSLDKPDWDSYGEWLPFPLKDGARMIPFDGDGHRDLCFDYRKHSDMPVITMVDTEGVRETFIAESFAAYLKLLEPDVAESEFALSGLEDIEGLKQIISISMGMDIDQPSSRDYGYVQHRLIREGREHPECVWLSPNLVPIRMLKQAGPLTRAEFARMHSDDMPEAYEVKEKAKRFPGLTEKDWTITISEEITPEVLAAVRGLGLKVRPLLECHGLI